MEKITNELFSNYLSKQDIVSDPEYSRLAKCALEKERELRSGLDDEKTKCFEELFELTSQIHFLEVKDAFRNGCRLGARISEEFTI